MRISQEKEAKMRASQEMEAKMRISQEKESKMRISQENPVRDIEEQKTSAAKNSAVKLEPAQAAIQPKPTPPK